MKNREAGDWRREGVPKKRFSSLHHTEINWESLKTIDSDSNLLWGIFKAPRWFYVQQNSGNYNASSSCWWQGTTSNVFCSPTAPSK
jgi:hypothetical protein